MDIRALVGSNAATCQWCGEELDAEELADPLEKGERICDECYYEHFCIPCVGCDDPGSIRDGEEDALMVFEAAPGELHDVEPGVYEIIRYPYYVDAIVNIWLVNDALLKIYPMEPNVEDSQTTRGILCGHLCPSCMEKYRARPLWWHKIKMKLLHWRSKLLKRWVPH